MSKTKLKDLINESVLGELPSAKMFKYNKVTGKFEAPGKHTNEDVIKEEYIESMDYVKLDAALATIKKQWDMWKRGPLTEPSDIKPAQKELIDWVINYLKQNIK